MSAARDRTDRWRRAWDKQARTYDGQMRFMDRVLFGDSRSWACSQATGEVLEVAVGTGLNLAEYPDEVALTGIDFSDGMLGIARGRAAELGRGARLLQGNAHALPFADATFDTVVCTFGLCAIPDLDAAVAEMHRVLRPGGRLVLVDHVESSALSARAVQRLLELVTVPMAGEHFRRRPLNAVRTAGLSVERAERFKLGVVERLTARKPSDP